MDDLDPINLTQAVSWQELNPLFSQESENPECSGCPAAERISWPLVPPKSQDRKAGHLNPLGLMQKSEGSGKGGTDNVSFRNIVKMKKKDKGNSMVKNLVL